MPASIPSLSLSLAAFAECTRRNGSAGSCDNALRTNELTLNVSSSYLAIFELRVTVDGIDAAVGAHNFPTPCQLVGRCALHVLCRKIP